MTAIEVVEPVTAIVPEPQAPAIRIPGAIAPVVAVSTGNVDAA